MKRSASYQHTGYPGRTITVIDPEGYPLNTPWVEKPNPLRKVAAFSRQFVNERYPGATEIQKAAIEAALNNHIRQAVNQFVDGRDENGERKDRAS